MNNAQAIHAQPPTLIALVIFTMISLGLGVVANFAQRKGTFLEKYFLGNRSLGAIAVALTAAGHERRDLHGVPVAGLHVRLGGRSLDLLVHDRPADHPWGAGEAGRPDLTQDRRDHLARPVPRAVQQPDAGDVDEPARDVLPGVQPRSPVHGRGADHEDRPPLDGLRLVRERGRPGAHRHGVPARPGDLHDHRRWRIRPTAGSSPRSGPTCSRASSWRSGSSCSSRWR